MAKPIVGLVIAIASLISMYPISAVSQEIPGGASSFPKKIYADYNKELRESNPRSDGLYHVDTPRLIEKLKEGAISTYAFLIWHEKSDWDDFRLEFLPAAQKAKIDTWIYLTPPSENNPPEGYEPYGTDYITWAKESAKLSTVYPVLRTMVIDDFNGNQEFFTPEYVGKIINAIHSINPKLAFYVINYDSSVSQMAAEKLISTAFANKYYGLIDGVILPYLNWDDKDNLADEKSQIMENNNILTGKRDQFFVNFPWNKESKEGDYSSVSETIKFPYAYPYRFKFRVSDDYNGPTNGYHKLQVLINNKIIWNEDAGSGPNVRYVDLNIQPYIKKLSKFTITVRVFEQMAVGNYGIAVNWDLPVGKWTMKENGTFANTGKYHSAKKLKIPFIILIYANGYGGIWRPSDDYLNRANIIAHETLIHKNIKGIMQSGLDKSENSSQFPIVKKLYKKWQNILGNNAMEVFPDNKATDDIDFQE